jgi:hypothetical protein
MRIGPPDQHHEAGDLTDGTGERAPRKGQGRAVSSRTPRWHPAGRRRQLARLARSLSHLAKCDLTCANCGARYWD